MTTQDKIDKIIKEQYGNWKGRAYKPIKKLHDHMRSMTKPLKWWQVVVAVFGGKVKLEPLMTDEDYLEFLEKAEKENHRPVYQIPESFKELAQSKINPL
jgi:hypothetical protein